MIPYRIYQPMYPDFPLQVMDASYSELYLNAVIHYLSHGTLLPLYEKKQRFPLFENTDMKVIKLGFEEEFKQIFMNLMNSKSSLSNTDKDDLLKAFAIYGDDMLSIIPGKIPFKENMALTISYALKYTQITNEQIKPHFKTATDVLRLAVAMSEGDISLATNTRFINLKRTERRLLLSLLEKCNNIEEDMLRYKNRWIRLGEKLHPAEFKNKYPNSFTAFNKIRNRIHIPTFSGELNKAYKNKDLYTVLEFLKTNPGEYARKLDYTLREFPDKQYIIPFDFLQVASKVSTPVLLQLLEHFKNRNNNLQKRVFFPKGDTSKLYIMENYLKTITDIICNSVIDVCNTKLLERFSERDKLGKVFLDVNLKDYTVPFSQRSASKALNTISRGSKLNLGNKENITIRPFIYWKNENFERVDIDLSAVFFKENINEDGEKVLEKVDHISYTNLKSERLNCCHSGDITSAPEGASEFIDLDLEALRGNNVDYVALTVFSFSRQPFYDLPECFFGWMERKYPQSGEIYEPKTVVQKIDLTSKTSSSIPAIINLKTNQVIWSDLSLNNKYNVESTKNSMALIVEAMVNLNKPNLYDLFDLHTKGRGNKFVKSMEDADILFLSEKIKFENSDNKKIITPYDINTILAEYL